MNPVRIAILSALLATSVSASDLTDRIKAAGTPSETANAQEYTVKFVSPPAGATAAYATYTQTNGGLEYVTFTTLRRLPSGLHQVVAIIDHGADTGADTVLMSTGTTLRDAYERLSRRAAAMEPDEQAIDAYKRCVRSLLAPRNTIMAAR